MNTTTKKYSPVGQSWDEYEKQHYTPEEIAACDVRVALIGEMIKAREEGKITQKKLEELSGVRQPIISRMENGVSSPTLDTIMRLLAPLGKTLAVVDLPQRPTGTTAAQPHG